jgi:hypothetical protein
MVGSNHLFCVISGRCLRQMRKLSTKRDFSVTLALPALCRGVPHGLV